MTKNRVPNPSVVVIERAFFSYYGASRSLHKVLAKPETLKTIQEADHVHFACALDRKLDEAPMVGLERCRCRVSIDVQSHVSWLTTPESLNILRNCDVFFSNEREAEWIAGEIGTHAWLRGERPQRCLEIANICGVLSTRALGGVAGFPNLEELRDCELQMGHRA